MWEVSENISSVMVSDNSWDLLKTCVFSFSRMTDIFPKDFFIIEDSRNKVIRNSIVSGFGPRINLICNTDRLGHEPSLQKGYKKVKSQYLLHLDENYEFLGNKAFIANAISILEAKPDISQVMIRDMSNFQPKYGTDLHSKIFSKTSITVDDVEYKTIDGRKYKFPLVPSVWRTSDLDKPKRTVVLVKGACSTKVKL